METVEELTEFLEEALDNSAKNRIVDTGEAWSMMRRGGIPLDDAPTIREGMAHDMADYGFAILDASLELSRNEPGHEKSKHGFRRAGRVFEALVRNGASDAPTRGFHRVVASASYHLAGLAAIAFSLFKPVDQAEQNLNPAEAALISLLLRDIDSLSTRVSEWLQNEENSDTSVGTQLNEGDITFDEAISTILISGICKALANYEFALRTGQSSFADHAREKLNLVIQIADKYSFASLWWIARLIKHLLDDLWTQTLHQVVPLEPTTGAIEAYSNNRAIFIAALFNRSTSHLELWPSQIDAARRAADPNDDLVVALPTSAGKTRIAELTTLTTLSLGKRVLIVTPLRALSAQTERSFREAFSPLGASVSSLYGQSGLSAGDSDALRSSEIVVATPEKLDFALRSDPTIIDDVGVIVLDEGHLIGGGEREIRYEVLVQKLLRRSDADTRRIVCLSAILPRGNALNDMTAWIRSDEEGDAIRSEWRPTRQRFGTLDWRGRYGKLNYSLEDDGPFVSRFTEQIAPLGNDRLPYPRDLKDKTLMTAWELAAQGKRSLIFVTQANWVNGFGERALKLCKKGYLPNLLDDPSSVETAVMIGEEWLGKGHSAVECLKVGIAVHQGRLPSPFLREIERLLEKGVVKVIAASPTLAQGLNLNAAVLLVPYLVRAGVKIKGEEFANIAGRAGRAFVDSEGLILHVIHDEFDYRRREWRDLVYDVKARSLTSGLLIVIDQVVVRLIARGVDKSDESYEYLANNRAAWLEDPAEFEGDPLEDLVARLDLIVFGLIEALDADSDDLPQLLDEALEGSLWARQMNRLDPGVKRMQMTVLKSRARLIWKETTADQRKGHYAMGLGLEAGTNIDILVEEFGAKLDELDLLALQGQVDILHFGLCQIAEKILQCKPFVAEGNGALKPNWKEVLKKWLSGDPVSEIGADNIDMVEDAFTYRLVWALETIRTRKMASGWKPIDGVPAGAAAACVDTGLPTYQMTLLVRSGLPSRNAAKKILNQIEPFFFDGADIRNYLQSPEFIDALSDPTWPSPETAKLVRRYRQDMLSGRNATWTMKTNTCTLHDSVASADLANQFVRIHKPDNSARVVVATIEFKTLCPMYDGYEIGSKELVWGRVASDGRTITIHTTGPT